MPGAARTEIDIAGGSIITGSPDVFVNDAPAARVGDSILPHPPTIPTILPPPPPPEVHALPTNKLVEGSPNVFVNGIPKSRAGDIASCRHIIAPGSSNVIVN